MGAEGGHVVGDRLPDLRIPWGSWPRQRPPSLRPIPEPGKVERALGGHEEEGTLPCTVLHTPPLTRGRQESKYATTSYCSLHVGVFRKDQAEPPLGIEPEERYVGVRRDSAVNAYGFAGQQERLGPWIEPERDVEHARPRALPRQKSASSGQPQHHAHRRDAAQGTSAGNG